MGRQDWTEPRRGQVITDGQNRGRGSPVSAGPPTVRSMSFTALHRAVGQGPGPITDELLNAAIAAGATETDDLDWKSELPPAKNLAQHDCVKDIAAMANSGGGLIVYGVTETQKAATGRVDVGAFNETHERTLRSVAITAITPPVFGLRFDRLCHDGDRAVVMEIPASVDGPHLIYKGEYFGAPIRNDADTVWMKERQIEAMYRARFDESRHATEALDRLYTEEADAHDASERAWLIGAAHPRIPVVGQKLTHDQARDILDDAINYWERRTSGTSMAHPLLNVEGLNPRPGLRRWVARPMPTSGNWSKESWASVHHDGSVTIATEIGGEPTPPPNQLQGWQIREASIEHAVADLMALVRQGARTVGAGEYEVRLGITWTGHHDLVILDREPWTGLDRDGLSVPLHHYVPVEMTIDAGEDPVAFQQHLYDLATDVINQGGIPEPTVIQPPSPESQE